MADRADSVIPTAAIGLAPARAPIAGVDDSAARLAADLGSSKAKKNVFTLDEVQRHTSIDSCWVLLGNSVYDVTPYLRSHKAGAKSILKYAGQDISYHVQFHSSLMMKQMKKCYIGKLEKRGGNDCAIV